MIKNRRGKKKKKKNSRKEEKEEKKNREKEENRTEKVKLYIELLILMTEEKDRLGINNARMADVRSVVVVR